MRIRFLTGGNGTGPGTIGLKCFETAGADYPLKIPLRFIIEKPRVILPAESAVGGETLGGSVVTPNEAAGWVPVSNIGFEPLLVAGLAEAVPSADGDPLDPSQTLDQYKGVLTRLEQWCTDSCGVGSIDVQPSCKSADTNTVVYSIVSGGLEEDVTITVQQP